MRPIPNRLKMYRKVRGYSQTDVAYILGVRNSGMISRWEKGLIIPNGENLLKLTALYRTLTNALYRDFLTQLKDELQKREDALAKRKHHA